MGGECEAGDLPLDNWFAAMNACDIAIDDGAGGTVPQYRGGIEVALDDEPAAIIEELLKAACAEMSEVGGIWKIRVGGPGLPVWTCTDDDVLVSEGRNSIPFRPSPIPGTVFVAPIPILAASGSWNRNRRAVTRGGRGWRSPPCRRSAPAALSLARTGATGHGGIHC